MEETRQDETDPMSCGPQALSCGPQTCQQTTRRPPACAPESLCISSCRPTSTLLQQTLSRLSRITPPTSCVREDDIHTPQSDSTTLRGYPSIARSIAYASLGREDDESTLSSLQQTSCLPQQDRDRSPCPVQLGEEVRN